MVRCMYLKIRAANQSPKGYLTEGVCFAFILLVIVLWCRALLFENGLPLSPDALGFQEQTQYYYDIFHSWFSSWNWGPYVFSSQLSPVLWALHFLNIPLRIMPVAFLVIGCFSSYLFLSRHVRNTYGKTVGVLVYNINGLTALYVWQGPYPAFLLAHALLPALLLLFEKAAQTMSIRDTLLFAMLASVFVSTVSPQESIILLSLLLCYGLWYFVAMPRKRRLRFLASVVASAVLVAGLLSYQLLPLFYGVTPWFAGWRMPIEEAYLFSYPLLAGVYITGGVLVSLMAFSSLLFSRDKRIFFFVLVAVGGLFLAKGPHPPLGEVFVWLWDHVPFFDTFRQGEKWQSLTILAYSFLVSRTCEEVFARLPSLASMKSFIPRNLANTAVKKIVPFGLILLVTFSLFYSMGIVQAANPAVPLVARPQVFDPNNVTAFRESASLYDRIGRTDDNLSYFLSLEPFSTYYMTLEKGNEVYYFLNPLRYNAYLSGKPELGFGYDTFGNSLTYWFPRNVLMGDSSTQVGAFLGALNVRYVVSPLPNSLETEISNQEGMEPLASGGTVAMWENQNSVPHVYGGEPIAFLGGFETFTSLPEIAEFNYSHTPLASVAQNWKLHNFMLENFGTLVFYDTGFQDLVALGLLNSNDTILIRPKLAYLMHHRETQWANALREEEWVETRSWLETGAMVFNELTTETQANADLAIPLSVSQAGRYEFWIRLAYGPDRGDLDVKLDGNSILKIRPYAQFYSFKWDRISLDSLANGKHTLEFINDGSGFSSIDVAFLSREDQINLEEKRLSDEINSAPIQPIYIWDAKQLFGPSLPVGWNVTSFETIGSSIRRSVLTGEKDHLPISADVYLPKNSTYAIQFEALCDGTTNALKLYVDNVPVETFEPPNNSTHCFHWSGATQVWLDAGVHKLSLEAIGEIRLDRIVLAPIGNYTQLSGYFKRNEDIVVHSERLAPYMWNVETEAKHPFLLVLSELYDPLWRAYLDHDQIKPVLVNDLFSGFWIEAGKHIIVLEYVGQQYVWTGGFLSSLTISAIVVLALRRKLCKILRSWTASRRRLLPFEVLLNKTLPRGKGHNPRCHYGMWIFVGRKRL